MSNHLQTGLELFETVYVVRETVSNGFKLLTSLRKCHKAILSVRSPVFQAMFEKDLEETKKNEVSVVSDTEQPLSNY
jgi:hypothetical protein